MSKLYLDISHRINRYIMECKLNHQYSNQKVQLELIDTLWNVNMKNCQTAARLLRINRYIMECKLWTFSLRGKRYGELIDTLWNVNLKKLLIL